jgi:hypothetical protein
VLYWIWHSVYIAIARHTALDRPFFSTRKYAVMLQIVGQVGYAAYILAMVSRFGSTSRNLVGDGAAVRKDYIAHP